MVYLAGPITAKDGFTVAQNVEAAAQIYFQLVRANILAFCPQLGATIPAAFDIDYAAWMRYDFQWIDRCTHMLMLPRWETSHGATMEHVYAVQKEKLIFYDVNVLIQQVRET